MQLFSLQYLKGLSPNAQIRGVTTSARVRRTFSTPQRVAGVGQRRRWAFGDSPLKLFGWLCLFWVTQPLQAQEGSSPCPFTTIGKSLVELNFQMAQDFVGSSDEKCEKSQLPTLSEKISRFLEEQQKTWIPTLEKISAAYHEISRENTVMAPYVYEAIKSRVKNTFLFSASKLTSSPFYIVVNELQHHLNTLNSVKTSLEILNTSEIAQQCIDSAIKQKVICNDSECFFRPVEELAAQTFSKGAQFAFSCGTKTVVPAIIKALEKTIGTLNAVSVTVKIGAGAALYKLSEAIAVAGQLESEARSNCINMGGISTYVYNKLPGAERTFIQWLLNMSMLFNHCELDRILSFLLSHPTVKQWFVNELLTPVACTMGCMSNLINSVSLPIPHPYFTGGYISLGYDAALGGLSGGHNWDVFTTIDQRPGTPSGIHIGVSSSDIIQVATTLARIEGVLGLGLHAGCYTPDFWRGGFYSGGISGGWEYIVSLSLTFNTFLGTSETTAGPKMLAGWLTAPNEIMAHIGEPLPQFIQTLRTYSQDKNSALYQVLTAFPIDKIFEIISKRTLITPDSLVNIGIAFNKDRTKQPTSTGNNIPKLFQENLKTILATRNQKSSIENMILANPFIALSMMNTVTNAQQVFSDFFKSLVTPILQVQLSPPSNESLFAYSIDPAWLYATTVMVQSLLNSADGLSSAKTRIEQYIEKYPSNDANPWINVSAQSHMSLKDYMASRMRWAHWALSKLKNQPAGFATFSKANELLGAITLSLLIESMMLGPEKSELIGFNQNRHMNGCLGGSVTFSAGLDIATPVGLSLAYSTYRILPDSPFFIQATTCDTLIKQGPRTLGSLLKTYFGQKVTHTTDVQTLFREILTQSAAAHSLLPRLNKEQFDSLLGQTCNFNGTYPGLSPLLKR